MRPIAVGAVVLVRIANALATNSFFLPDEYYQSLEVAHRTVFGYGYRTWEWRRLGATGGIRSPLYPVGVFVPVYWVVKVLGLEDTMFLTLAPKLAQALIAAACDIATYLLARRVLGPKFALPALICSLTSFYNAYASTRTLSNSTEAALTLVAMTMWPWEGMDPPVPADPNPREHGERARRPKEFTFLTGSLILAALTTIIRPSNVVIWLILGLHLLSSCRTLSHLKQVLLPVLSVSLLSILLCLLLDSAFYSTPTFTPWTFLEQNVFNSISLYYGKNVSHFYFSQAIPVLTLTQLPFVIHGLWITLRSQWSSWGNGRRRGGTEDMMGQLVKVVFGTIAVYSFLGHKEWRFIHPLLPLLHIFAALSLVTLSSSSPSSSPSYFYPPSIRKSHLILLLLSLPPFLFLSNFHGTGQLTSIEYLGTRKVGPELKSLGVLMPCHSTPWQSHLHQKDLEIQGGGGGSGEGGRAWFITCEPPNLGQNLTTYVDQTDVFFASPSLYLRTRFPPHVNPSFPPSPFLYPSSSSPSPQNWAHEWPSHLLLFQSLLDAWNDDGDGGEGEGEGTIGQLLREKGYEEEKRWFNSVWHDERWRRGDVVLLRWEGGGGE